MIYLFTTLFALGILIENIFNLDLVTSLFIFLISIVVSFMIWKENKKIAQIMLVVSIALVLGILRMHFVDNLPDPKFSKSVGEKISFNAVIDSEGDERDTSTRYVVKPDGTKSKILLVAERFPEYKYGDKIKVSGKLDLPENFETDTGVEFDYVSYLRKDNIHFLIYRPQLEKVGESSNPFYKTVSVLYSFKHILISNISRVVPEPNSSFLAGVIFGEKQSLGDKLLDDFKKVGLIHVVVLSGYNITIIAYGILLFASYFGKRNWGFVSAIIILLFFALMVGLSATVVRAVVMALIAILARFLGRPSDALRALFIAGFLMLFWNPLTLTSDPSFQLSFMATLGLILFSPIIYSFISQKITWIGDKYELREIVSSTFAVQIFILPLLIKMSGQVSIISFLVNPLLLPLIPLTMALGALTSAFGLIPLIGNFLSWPFGILSYFVSEIIIRVVTFSASIPFASISVPSLSISIVALWYLFYAFLYYKLNKNQFHGSKIPNI